MSLWIWRPTISLENTPERTLSSSVVKASYALVSTRPVPSQTLDKWESAFFFSLVSHALLLQVWGDLFHRGGRGSCPRHFRDESNRSDWSPLLHYAHHAFPEVRERLVLLSLHLRVHLLVELRRHLCKRKTLENKKKKKQKQKQKQKQNKRKKIKVSDEQIRHLLFSSILMVCKT